MRSVISLVLAVGLCLLLAAPATAQGTVPAGSIPADLWTPLNEGYTLLAAGKYDAAAVQFKKVTKKDLNNPFALNNLAAIASQKGDYKGAMALLKQATTHADKYKNKVSQTCFVAGLCNAVKVSKEMGAVSTVAPLIQENIAKLEPKVKALPPKPSTPPPMEKKIPGKEKGK
jgi:tetratricopeptide (TPR) repeat protein